MIRYLLGFCRHDGKENGNLKFLKRRHVPAQSGKA